MTQQLHAPTAVRRHRAQVQLRECVVLMDQHPAEEQLYALLGAKAWSAVLMDDITASVITSAVSVAAADQYAAAVSALHAWVEQIAAAGAPAAVRSLVDALEDAA